jgi:type I restriction enzyme S subunit
MKTGYKKTELGEIPEDWKALKFGEIADIKRGASPRPIKDPKFFSKTGRGWVRIADLTASNKYLEQTTQYLSSEGENNSVKIEPGELIMSICATVGKPLISKIRACIHDGFVLFKDLEKKEDINYFYYLLQSLSIKLASLKQVGTQGNLNAEIVSNIIVPIPPILEQYKIAEVLSTVDEAITLADEKIQKTEKLKKGLMQRLLTKGIGHKKFKKTELGEIPENWELVTIGEIIDVIRRGPFGGAIKKQIFVPKGYKIYEQKNVINNDFSLGNYYINEDKYNELKSFAIEEDDILISTAGTIGKMSIVPKIYKPGIINQAMMKITVNKEKISPEFFFEILQFPQYTKEIVGSSQGATMKNILKISEIKKIRIPLPPLVEQNIIVTTVNDLKELLEEMGNNKKMFEKLKKSLMADLLSGKRRVCL